MKLETFYYILRIPSINTWTQAVLSQACLDIGFWLGGSILQRCGKKIAIGNISLLDCFTMTFDLLWIYVFWAIYMQLLSALFDEERFTFTFHFLL